MCNCTEDYLANCYKSLASGNCPFLMHLSYLCSTSTEFTWYQKRFTIFTCARPFSISFLKCIMPYWFPCTGGRINSVVALPCVCHHARPVVFQQTRVPNSLLMGANSVDYEPQGTEVIQVCLQTIP